MKKSVSVGCVIMASGLSHRFGSNKLLADFNGKPMLCCAFDATDTSSLTGRIVVTRSEEVQSLCEQYGIPVLLHNLPGRNDTVRLGLSALLKQEPELAGCMFLPGDQPLLRRATVERLVCDFCQNYGGSSSAQKETEQKETERKICRLGHRLKNGLDPLVGSPVLFGSGYFAELCSLPDSKGGNILIKKYPAQVHTVYISNREELADADTPEALARLEVFDRDMR